MEDLVRVQGVARLGADPELRTLQSGTSLCKLRVVWNNRGKSKAGEWEDQACWFDMTVWGSSGEVCAKYLSKGSAIVFLARLEQRSWTTDDGNKRYAYDLVAERVQFVGGKKDDGGGFTPRSDVPAGVDDFQPVTSGGPPGSSGGPPGMDDDIPFAPSVI